MGNTTSKGKWRPPHSGLTVGELRHALAYDPDTGKFTWRNPTSRRLRAGDPAGYMSQGYLHIRVGYTKYLGHRLAWLYVHGEWPKNLVDHVNRDRGDNRIANLREADFSTNGANSDPRPRRDATLPRGVTKSGPCHWTAQIKVRGKQNYLGSFETPEAAGEAYRNAAAVAFGAFVGAE